MSEKAIEAAASDKRAVHKMVRHSLEVTLADARRLAALLRGG